MLPSADRTARTAHRRARHTVPRVVRGTAFSCGLVAAAAMGTGIAVVRHRLGLHDVSGAVTAPPAP
ncbi:hypothetical protein DSM104299_03948 [Baekduia alba]|uniref:hypothetical protein n=1 Tax=Baekduia alba TaxID=2997333 RepID=UPI00233F82CF|nr:hypothetical protein [Baekduia alba]WCB95205.1 hypothetical protein DSM104299_03948 [Baekduia alba]